MVPSEAEPGRSDTDQTSKDEIPAVVAVIGETRARNIDGGADGNQNEDESPHWGRRSLVSDRNHVVFAIATR